MKNIFWIVGDPSADLHCANVIRELHQLAPEVKHLGLGGQNMQKEGFVLLHDLCSEAIMGFVEVLKHLSDIKKLMNNTVNWIKEYKPEGIILVDFPGFNLHIAPEIKKLGIPIIYYISPQVWAWKKNRVKTIAQYVNKVLVIFPFEVPIYKQAGVDCVYVGHPLLDRIPSMRTKRNYTPPFTIALLPGSRPQEIKRIFPVMLQSAIQFQKTYPDTKFVVPAFNKNCAELIKNISGNFLLEVYEEGIEKVLQTAHAGIVTSGTATLESALHGMPFILVYRTHPLTYLIARLLVHVPYIGIVNILMERQVVPELIQNNATPSNIHSWLIKLIENLDLREKMVYDFKQLRERLGAPGAGKQTAIEILRTLNIII